MEYFADLHIHSCLSPCGDEDMTPANICGMAKLKGLDAIAICDHNSARNLPAAQELCDAYGLLLLPGMEITTREEVHLLGYFETVEAALAFGGVPVPAHINREANGLLINLGLMPPEPFYSTVEVWRLLPCDEGALRGRHVLHSSDAHYLGDIQEREHALRLREGTTSALLAWMRSVKDI